VIRKLSSLLRRVASKPIDVVIFRLAQELLLVWTRYSGGWDRVATRADQLKAPSMKMVLIKSDAPCLSELQRATLLKWSNEIKLSDFKIFGSNVPKIESCDFSTDWCFSHSWDSRYFKLYSFYEKKDVPYDVKFPWELSRLSFVVPVLAQQIIFGADSKTIEWVLSLLKRWDKENPVAYSVNWYPMEASMRCVNLVLMLDLAKATKKNSRMESLDEKLDELIVIISKLLFKNAAFVWRTKEYTDVRGNHYTANLAALYLASLALRGLDRECKRWHDYSRERVEKEIELQFYSDGVNFEKAFGYHKLVLELFTLVAISREMNGDPLAADCLNLIEKAAFFSDAITRPDGLVANFGDNDDATAIPFSLTPLRSHGAIVELIRRWRCKPIGTVKFSELESIAANFLVGKISPPSPIHEGAEYFNFDCGGYSVARNQENGFFFVADIGEVGMGGRGGHGHNDILSFELFINGLPVVLDPGCSGYTADLDKKAWYRGTEAHSTIQLFDSEMADLITPWTISNHAVPSHVEMESDNNELRISCCHAGYSRIHEGSWVCRKFIVNPKDQSLHIYDDITAPEASGSATWHFPCGLSEAKPHKDNEGYAVTVGGAIMKSELKLSIKSAPFSEGYGVETMGSVISAKGELNPGVNSFCFSFFRSSLGVRL